MSPPSRTRLIRLGLLPSEWDALAALARAAHPRVGQIVGFCVCGANGYQPTPEACRVLQALLDLAELAEAQTR